MLLNPFRFTTGSNTGLIGAYLAGLWGGYSLDVLSSTYGGACVRLRRSSDNAEQDIGFSSGAIDAGAVAAFVGSDSAYITTWYDQAGGGNHLIQPTTTRQPRLVNAGSLSDAAVFDGSNDAMETTNAGGTPTAVTMFFFGELRNSGPSTVIHSIGNPQNSRGAQFSSGGTTNIFGAVTGPGGFDAATNYWTANFNGALLSGDHVYSTRYLPTDSGAKVRLYVDGSNVASTSTAFPGSLNAAFASAKHRLAARLVDGTFAANLDCRTFLLYESDKVADIAAISAAIS